MADEFARIRVVNQSELDRLIGTDPEMERMFRSCIKKVLSKARSGAVKELKGQVGTGYKHSKGDPRDSYKAVKYSVYKRALGGNISILNKRKATNIRIEGQKGKNAYYGSDRGFVLRFLNSGTRTREGNRGSISASRMFSDLGDKYIDIAVKELNMLVQQKIQQQANKI